MVDAREKKQRLRSSGQNYYSAETGIDSLESLYAEQLSYRPWIYWLILLLLAAGLSALPLVKIDVGVVGSGMLRSNLERTLVVLPMGGYVTGVTTKDNEQVRAGDVLVQLESRTLGPQLDAARKQIAECRMLIADLETIAGATRGMQRNYGELADAFTALAANCTSGVYKSRMVHALSQLRVLHLQVARAETDLRRAKELINRQLLSQSDFDNAEFAQRSASTAWDQHLAQIFTGWDTDRLDLERRQREAQSLEAQLLEQVAVLRVVAPIDGAVVGFSGISVGAYLPAGTQLAEISPAGALLAEIYFSTKDVGFLRQGQPVRVQVDTYPQSEWGALPGVVEMLSHDVVRLGDSVGFKALVRLQADKLVAADGRMVTVKRGLGVRAHMLVARKSLFQLLYQKASNWADPRNHDLERT